ncbi:MAG: hypothetical protein IPL77_21805 [Flavobacteriales bacterium]|nr:hypothetical protein [Flavobacteriales bacterium]
MNGPVYHVPDWFGVPVSPVLKAKMESFSHTSTVLPVPALGGTSNVTVTLALTVGQGAVPGNV